MGTYSNLRFIRIDIVYACQEFCVPTRDGGEQDDVPESALHEICGVNSDPALRVSFPGVHGVVL